MLMLRVARKTNNTSKPQHQSCLCIRNKKKEGKKEMNAKRKKRMRLKYFACKDQVVSLMKNVTTEKRRGFPRQTYKKYILSIFFSWAKELSFTTYIIYI